MKIKTFILTFLLAMSCPFLFGQSRDGEAVITDLLSLKNAITSSVGSEDPVVAYLDNSVKGITEAIVVPEGANFCLDLNNFTLESSSNVYVFKNLGKLQIIDRSQYKKGTIKTKGIENGDGKLNAQLTMENVTFKNAEGTNGGALVYNKVAAKATIDGGSYEGNNIALLNYGVMNVTNVARIEGKSQNFKIYEGSTLNISKSYIYGNYYQLIGSATVGTTADDEVIEGEGVMFVKATVGGKPYASLHDAVVAANDKADAETNQTVELLYDVVETQIVEAKFVGTINGNNKKLTSTAERAINVNVDDFKTDDVVTIKDLTIVGKGTEGCERGINIIRTNEVTEPTSPIVKIDNVDVSGVSHYAVHVAKTGAAVKVNINDSDLSAWGALAVYGEGTVCNVKDSNLTGNNTYTGNSDDFATIAFDNINVEINVNGGTVTAKSSDGYRTQSIVAKKEVDAEAKEAKVVLNTENLVLEGSNVEYFGGEFDEIDLFVSESLVETLETAGYALGTPVEGLVSVEGIAVAVNDGKNYTSLQAALNEVTDGDVIEIIAEEGEEGYVNYNGTAKEFTVKLAETSNYTVKGFDVQSETKVTINGINSNSFGVKNANSVIEIAGEISTFTISGEGSINLSEGAKFTVKNIDANINASGSVVINQLPKGSVTKPITLKGATLAEGTVFCENDTDKVNVIAAEGENIINTRIATNNLTVNAGAKLIANANVVVNNEVEIKGDIVVDNNSTFLQKNNTDCLVDGAVIKVVEGSTFNLAKPTINGTVEFDVEGTVEFKYLPIFKEGAKLDVDLNDENAKLVATEITSDQFNIKPGENFQGKKVIYKNGTYIMVPAYNPEGGEYVYNETQKIGYTTLAEALEEAADGNIIVLYAGGEPIAMNGAVYGKTVTIKTQSKTTEVEGADPIVTNVEADWSKGWLFVGRGGEGDGKLIFDNVKLKSSSDNNTYGINVSGRKKETEDTYNGVVEIANSKIELDYLINKGAMTLKSSTLTVKNGFSVGGRPASETEDGKDATATMTLSENSNVVVYNHNGMGLGYEALGIMTIDETSTFETTQNFLVTAYGTMNVNGGTVKIAEGKTLTNAGTVYVTGESNIFAEKVTGDGWFYMNGVSLGADTKLLGAKVRFASGTNNIDGSTIDNGFFQVGIGAFYGTDANVDTENRVIVNVKNAHIGSNGSAYAGWAGTGFYNTDTEKADAMTEGVKYVLNIENSIAEFGYLHISNDGELNVKGKAAEQVSYNNSEYSFYAGDFIINGTATFDATDVLAIYTKVSCDNSTDNPGTLNINAETEYEAERHNGAIAGTNFILYKTGVANVAKGANLHVGELASIAEKAKFNIGGTATILGTVTNNGTIALTDLDAKLSANADLTVTNGTENGDIKVVYKDGAYQFIEKVYVAQIDEIKYESVAEALTKVQDKQIIEIIAEGTEDKVVVYPAADAEEGGYAKEFSIKSVGEGANYQVSVLFQKDVNVDLTDAVIYDLRSFDDAVISLNNTTVNGMLYSKNNKAEVTGGNVTINKLYSEDGQDGAIKVTGTTNLVVKQNIGNPIINMTDVTLDENTTLPTGVKVEFVNTNTVNNTSLKGNIVFNNGTTTFEGASLTGSVNVEEGATVYFTKNTYLNTTGNGQSVIVAGTLIINASGAWATTVNVAETGKLNIEGRNEIDNTYLGNNDLNVRGTLTNYGTITIGSESMVTIASVVSGSKLVGNGTLEIAGIVDALNVAKENIANTIELNGADAKFYAPEGLTNVKDIQGLLEPKYENGYYSLAGEFVAQVGNNKYRTFSSALDAEINGNVKTITLLDEITTIDLTAEIDADEGVTINVTTGDKELSVEGEITVNSGTLEFDNAKLVQGDANFDIIVESNGIVNVNKNSSIKVKTISNDGNFENNGELTVKTLDNTNEFNNGNVDNTAAKLTVETLNNKYVDEFNYAAKFNNYAKLAKYETTGTSKLEIVNDGEYTDNYVGDETNVNVITKLTNNNSFENNGKLTVETLNNVAGTITNTGTLNGTSFVNGAIIKHTKGQITAENFTNNSTVNVSGNTAQIKVTNNVSGTGTFNMSNVKLNENTQLKNANIEFVEGTSSYNSITSTISGATLTNSKLTVSGDHTLNVTENLALGNNGTLTNYGTVKVSGVELSGNKLTNGASAIVSIENNATAEFKTIENNATGANNNEYYAIKVSGSTLKATSSFTNNGRVEVSGSSVLSATVTGTGTFEMEGVQLTDATTLNGAIINFNGEGNQVKSSNLLNSTVTVIGGAELTLEGATTGDIINNGTLNLTGKVKAGEVTNEGTINMDDMDDVDAKFYTETDELVINTTYAGNEVQRDEDDYGKYYYINDDYVAQVGETNYALLQAAIVAAGENGTVTIIAGEITESVTVSNNTTFVLGTDITAATINGKLTVDGTAEFDGEYTFDAVELDEYANVVANKLTTNTLSMPGNNSILTLTGEGSVLTLNGTGSLIYGSARVVLAERNATFKTVYDVLLENVVPSEELDDYKVSYKNGQYQLVSQYVAQIGDIKYESLAKALEVVASNGKIELLWEEGDDPIVMKGVLSGKNVTIKAAANNDPGMVVDWSEGRLYIGRMAENNNGPATLTFDGVKFTSVNDTDADYGIFVSGRVKNSEHYNGTLVIKDSEVEISSIYNQNNTEIENSTVTFETAKGVVVSGINAGDSPTGDMTTSTLDINNSTVNVENITVGERGVGRVLVDVDLVENEFTPDNNGKSQITVSTLNVLANGILLSAGDIAGTMTNAGRIQLCGGIYTMQPQEGWCAENYGAFQLPSLSWIVRETGGTQTTKFAEGWHWYSTYIDEVTLGDVQEQLLNYASQIKSQVAFTTNFGTSWSTGGLNTFSPAEMYMINVTKQGTLEFSGDFVDYSNTDIELQKNWNWIGYPVNIEVNVNVALKNLQPEYGDQIKGKNGFAYYRGEAIGWMPSNLTLLPGNGYMYHSNSDATKTFVYNAVEAEEEGTETRATEVKRWNADATQYPSNMTMIAMVSMDGEVVNGNYEVAAFANGELRGSARPIYVEDLDAYMLFLSINGDEVEELTFKYYDVNYGTEYVLNNRINYSTDAMLGSMDEPYMLTLDILNIDEAAANEISIYPNPTTTNVEINLNATCDTVEVFNALGVKVAEYSNVDSIDALETAGVYVIRITNDGNVQNCRLVVK